MGRALAILLIALLGGTSPAASGDRGDALSRLLAGNHRYVTGTVAHPNQTAGRRRTVASSQHPFAIILGCSDSRVPPEVVFDQGLGDLFVIRVAGNIADPAALGSIEYAAEHLGVGLVVVLGHSRCGAVDAAVKGGEAPGHIPVLVDAIMPAVEKTREQPGDRLDNAVKANALLVAEQLRTSDPVLSHLVHDGKLRVVAARYDLESGKVDVLPTRTR